jgi:hypothetical protein
MVEKVCTRQHEARPTEARPTADLGLQVGVELSSRDVTGASSCTACCVLCGCVSLRDR